LGKKKDFKTIEYQFSSEVAPSTLTASFQQLEGRRKDIRESIFNSGENIITFTIRDDHIMEHQENLKECQNHISKEWKGKALRNNKMPKLQDL
jgi:archaeosine-15-forming tRNA-guanine transglycosylase